MNDAELPVFTIDETQYELVVRFDPYGEREATLTDLCALVAALPDSQLQALAEHAKDQRLVEQMRLREQLAEAREQLNAERAENARLREELAQVRPDTEGRERRTCPTCGNKYTVED